MQMPLLASPWQEIQKRCTCLFFFISNFFSTAIQILENSTTRIIRFPAFCRAAQLGFARSQYRVSHCSLVFEIISCLTSLALDYIETCEPVPNFARSRRFVLIPDAHELINTYLVSCAFSVLWRFCIFIRVQNVAWTSDCLSSSNSKVHELPED
jgi:hypothetical protein